MAEVLVQRVRAVVGAENDDFFRTDTIVEYLNAAQHKVVSYLIRNEVNSGQTLRALDSLRGVHEQIISGTPVAYGTYEYVDVEPTSVAGGIQEILYVSFIDDTKTIRCKELPSKKLFLLDWGNIRPSTYESYYFITGGGTKFRVFAADITAATDKVRFNYVKQPTGLTDVSTEVAIAKQFTNAVVYGAAIMLGVQEQRGNVQDMMSLYKKELENNIY